MDFRNEEVRITEFENQEPLDLPQSVLRELRSTDDASYTARCKKLAGVLMWIEGVELNRIEASLLRHLPADNAAGPIRSTAERTRDLLGVVARIAGLVSVDQSEPIADRDELSTRLEIGIPKDVVWLARLLKRALERGDYLSLRRAQLTTVGTLDNCEEKVLMNVIQSAAKTKADQGCSCGN